MLLSDSATLADISGLIFVRECDSSFADIIQ